MLATVATRRRYDHRIRNAVLDGRDLTRLQKLAIPSSTMRSWARRGATPVVVLDTRDADVASLESEVLRLEQRIARLLALVHLLVVFLRTMSVTLDDVRVPTTTAKRRILAAVERAARVLGRHAALRVVGLTDARLRERKKRELPCALDDAAPCPRTFPSRLTRNERGAIRDLVEDDRYKHLPIRSLALLGKRLGRVFASYATWRNLIREHGWRRSRVRLHPAKRTIGVRATAPNEWWHVDMTIVRLLDATKAYLHGVIDNHSRKVLAWTIEPILRAEKTRTILLEAKAKLAADTRVKVTTDGGSENLIIGKDTDLSAIVDHVVAQAAIHVSNSMIEPSGSS